MRRDWAVSLVLLGGFLLLIGCRATLAGDPDRPIRIEAHITIDIREVKETANSIEELVSGGAAQTANRPSSSLWNWVIPPAYAGSYDLKEMTPEIQAALNRRKARYDTLKEFKDKDWVGEDVQGHAAALGGDSGVAALVALENQDREIIYQAIVQQNGLPADAIETVRAAFGEVQRERAGSGDRIQLPSGQWVDK